MPKSHDPQWEDALTVVQEVHPPFIPEGADVMTVVIEYPPGSAGAPPHRHPSGPAFGYMLEGEMLFELEGQPPRVIRAGEAFWEPGGDVIHYSDANNRDDVKSRFVVTMVCVPGRPMLELVGDDELAARSHLRVPADPATGKDWTKVSRILLQTTITAQPDDWDITRFSRLAAELRGAGHEVVARNRVPTGDDPVLSVVDDLPFDQLWLMAVDTGDGLTEAEADAITRFRRGRGGVLTARDHQDLGCCLTRLGSLGLVNEFQDKSVDQSHLCDDRDTPTISWPNYHSGANGDYQPVLSTEPVHPLLRTARTASGRIEWFPAHPHEGAVAATVPCATVVAEGRSSASGRRFNLAVAIDGETCDGLPMGRAVAESTFHHFADYNWDLACGSPSFVSEPPGTQILADPSRLAVFKDYVRNVADWLHPAVCTGTGDALMARTSLS
jgi:quercetin dioxygenase-like cupin family protein